MAGDRQRCFWGYGWENFYVQFWDKTEVLNRLRSLHHQGKPINLAAVAASGDWYLIRAASYYFGSWRKAVEAAGFSYDDIRADIRWTPEKVVREIRRLHRRSKDISSRRVQLQHPDLFAAAVRKRTFGSWERAVEACGLSYEGVRKYRSWSDARLREGLRSLEASGAPLNARHVSQADPTLYFAACHRYQSWGKALLALGYDPRSVALRRRWTKEEVRNRMRELKSDGVHLSDNNVRRLHPSFHAAACRLFGSWTAARDGSGNGRKRGGNGTGYLPGFAAR